MKKVSIIIPIYNAEKTINKCLDSLLNQTYKNIEIILINNNSTDDSLNICNKYSKSNKKIKILSEKKAGSGAARNKGLINATGDYITFVDSDDFLQTDAIENMIKLIKKYKTDVIRTFYNSEIPTYEEKSHNIKYNKLYLKEEITSSLVTKILSQEMDSYIWLLLIKKDILKDIRFNEDLLVHQDINFYLDLLYNINSIYISNVITYNYCYNENSSKSLQYYKRNIYNLLELNKSLKETIYKYNVNNKELYTIINSKVLQMLIPYFSKIYFTNKSLFYEIYENYKINLKFKNMTSNIKYKYISINILIEYLLLFKISKNLYIIYINFIKKFKIKELLKKFFS